MSVLQRKLGRDLLRSKGQVLTIALVLACGVMALIMMRSTWDSLARSRDGYYASERFGDVFARVERAPESAAEHLMRLPGVARVYTRVVRDVMLPLEDELGPVSGRIVSIPAKGAPPLNGLVLRAGRMPSRDASDEAVVLDQFADAHGLRAGDVVPAVLNGVRRDLHVVGIGASPEYLFALGPGQTMADPRHFGVLWMVRERIAPVFGLDGSFDDAVLALAPNASLPAVLAGVDAVLAPYGGRHAVARDHQLSNATLTAELEQLGNIATIVPTAFLAVAAFLVNVVMSRLVGLERGTIAILKALGRSDGSIAIHYLSFVGSTVVIGTVFGIALGVWAGDWMTGFYTHFFRFPARIFYLAPELLLAAVGIAAASGLAGALGALRAVMRMPPAEAMRPPAPAVYRSGLRHLSKLTGPAPMMIVREISRRPTRFLFSVVGIALGVGIFIFGRFSWDSFDRYFDESFARAHREDETVSFTSGRPLAVIGELAHLPGVLAVEPTRSVPVRFHAGHRWRDAAIVSVSPGSALRHVIDGRGAEVEVPEGGLLMVDRLAVRLGVRPGDTVLVEVLEGDWRTRPMRVAALVDEPLGIQAYAGADWLDGVLGSEPRAGAALLRVDRSQLASLEARLKELPAVLATARASDDVARRRAQTGESMHVVTLILSLSAAAIAIGVVYNNARIALATRSRDLASLRVLGLTRSEISTMLLGELTVQVVLGVALGLALGHHGSRLYAIAIENEYMRFPFFIALRTYSEAAAIALLAALSSAFLVRRRLDALDLVSVLKATE